MRALLIIDMQNDICRDLRRAHLVNEMLAPLKMLIEEFSAARLPVFYAVFSLKEDDEQFVRFGDRYCIEGTEGAEIIPELRPLRGPVIRKTKHSAFFATELHEKLIESGVSDLYLTGLQTQICIMTTAADASFRGYRVFAVEDCVVSTREENKRQALEWIARYVGEVVSLERALRDIRA